MERILHLTVLICLALAGLAISTAFEHKGWWAWVAIVAIFAGISMWLAYRSAKQHGRPVWSMLRNQVFHWLGLLGALKILFVLDGMGFVDRPIAGVIAMLLMALSCFYAGIWFDWLFLIVAVLLAEMSYVSALANEYMWLIMIPSAAVLVIGLFIYLRWRRHKTAAQAAATPAA